MKSQIDEANPSCLIPSEKFVVAVCSTIPSSVKDLSLTQRFFKLIRLCCSSDLFRWKRSAEFRNRLYYYVTRCLSKENSDGISELTRLVAPDYPLAKWQENDAQRRQGKDLETASSSQKENRVQTGEVYVSFLAANQRLEFLDCPGESMLQGPHCAILVYNADPPPFPFSNQYSKNPLSETKRLAKGERKFGLPSILPHLETIVNELKLDIPILIVGLNVSARFNLSAPSSNAKFPFFNNPVRQALWRDTVLPKYGHRLLIPRPIEIALGQDALDFPLLYLRAPNPDPFTTYCSESLFCLFPLNLSRCYFLTFAMFSFCDQGQGGALYLPKDIVMCILALCCVSEEKFSMHNFILFLTSRLFQARIGLSH